jgi:LPS sulfotransferase NodH
MGCSAPSSCGTTSLSLERLAGRPPEYAGLDRHELLRELFAGPRYVWVRRRDTVRQAVSLWRALQTRAWRQHLDELDGPIQAPIGARINAQTQRSAEDPTFVVGAETAGAATG